jgi:flagellin-like hook-associated protein FlgL
MGDPILNLVPVLGARRELGGAGRGLAETIAHLRDGAAARPEHRTSAAAEGVRLARQGRRNAGDGLRVLQAAEAAAEEASHLLSRAGELIRQALEGPIPGPAPGDLAASGAEARQAEYRAVWAALDDLDAGTTFNGAPVFGATLSLAVGEAAFLDLPLGRVDARSLRGTAGSLGDPVRARGEAEGLAGAQARLAQVQADLAAHRRRLAGASDALGVQAENGLAALGRIRDADLAGEVAALNKFQVLNRSGAEALSQARRSLLRLLR